MMTTAEELPEWLRQEVGHQAGMENVEAGDILIPRLSVCQALSPQKRKSHSSYIEGLQEGQLFNTVTGEIYGEEITIIALYFFKNRIKFNPIDDGGGIDCNSANGIDGGRISPDGCSICKFSTWGNGKKDDEDGNDAPLCTLYHNFMAFHPASMSPMAVSYKSTGLKVSKQLLSSVRMTRLPMYAKYMKITVTEMTSGNNMWYEKKIVPQGFVEQDLFKQMEAQFKALKEANIRVDTTGEEEGDASFDPSDSEERAF
jgi:hypothetical protein